MTRDRSSGRKLADLRAAVHHEFAVFVWRFAGMLIAQAALIIVAMYFVLLG